MTPTERCDANHPHDALLSIEGRMPATEELDALSTLFKIFSDPTRMRILCALSLGELCVCELADMLDMTQSAISHQLRILKDGRAVKSRREGRQIVYSLHDSHVLSIFAQGLVHVSEPPSGAQASPATSDAR